MILRTQSQTLRGSVTGLLSVYIGWKVYSSDGRFLSQGSFAEVLQSGPGFTMPAILANNVIVPGDVDAVRELSMVVLANTEADIAEPAVPFTIFVHTGESGRRVYTGSLKPGHEAHYYAGRGWSVYNADGLLVTAPEGSAAVVPSVHRIIQFHADATANVTLTNQVLARGFFGASDRSITQLDLTTATEVRLVARVVTASASASTPRLAVQYSSAFSTTIGAYADIGTSEVQCSLAATGLAVSAWTPLVAGAKIAACHVAVTQIGGDAVADPALGNVYLEIR